MQYSKTCVNGHSQIDKIKILMTNGILMKVESIAECSLGAFCNTFDLHLTIIGLFVSGHFTQVLLYNNNGWLRTIT